MTHPPRLLIGVVMAFSKEVVLTGFNCEFVEPPREQFECPICLLVLREPHQASCCGYRFCQSCIQNVDDVCPTCKKKKLVFFHDIGHKRHLYGLKVYCDHRKDGCEWIGELRQLDQHHSRYSQPEKGSELCQFIKIACIHLNCRERLERRWLASHQSKHCPQRPFSCEHCCHFNSTFDNVTRNHLPVCGSVPVSCPNKCGLNPQRQNIDYHLSSECPLEITECQFHHAGCSVKCIRTKMSQHLQENVITHMSLLGTSHVKQQAKIESLVAQNDELKSKNKNLEQNLTSHEANFRTQFAAFKEDISKQITSLQNNVLKLSNDCARLVTENDCLTSELKPLQRAIKASGPTICSRPLELGLPVLEMTDFCRHRDGDIDWHSPAVYTHSRGYNICLRVAASGESSGAGTNVSVFINFDEGAFDHCLNWPFRGAISVRMLDQHEYKNHKTESIIYDDTVEDKDCCKMVERDTESWGWGSDKFIAHSQLESKYLKNDTIQFQIFKVELQ